MHGSATRHSLPRTWATTVVCCKEMTRGNCWQKTRWIFIGKTRDTHMTPRLVRRTSGTTTAFGASGHLWATRTADLGLSGGSQRRSEVAADDEVGRLVRAGLDPADGSLQPTGCEALRFAPSHKGSVADCEGWPAIVPRLADEVLIRMERRTEALNHQRNSKGRGAADDPGAADLMAARGKALRRPSSSPVRPCGGRDEARLEPRTSVVGPR